MIFVNVNLFKSTPYFDKVSSKGTSLESEDSFMYFLAIPSSSSFMTYLCVNDMEVHTRCTNPLLLCQLPLSSITDMISLRLLIFLLLMLILFLNLILIFLLSIIGQNEVALYIPCIIFYLIHIFPQLIMLVFPQLILILLSDLF